MTTDIKKALTTLADKSSGFSKSKILALVTTLKAIDVHEMTSDKDKESFLKVSLLVKDLSARVKAFSKSLDEKHKPGIKELEEQLSEKKDAYKEAVEPFKDAKRELDRIDTEARDAVSKYMTAQIEAQQKVEAPKPGAGPAFMPAASEVSNLGISKGGHDLNFATKRVVHVNALADVPDNFAQWEPDLAAVSTWLTQAGIPAAETKVLADGTLTLKIAVTDLPKTLRTKTGVRDSAILAAGGCAGVTIKDEYRPVVK